MTSTSGLQKHAINCWGAEIVKSASNAADVHAAQTVLVKTALKNSFIMAAFEHVGKEKIIYSHCQHTRAESRCIVCQGPMNSY